MSKEGTLDGFGGFGQSMSEEDFFKETNPTTTSAAAVIEAATEESEEDKNLTPEAKTKKEEEQEEKLMKEVFGNFIEGNENQEVEEVEEEEDPNQPAATPAGTAKDPAIAALELLKEKGFVDYTLEENQELTPELAASLAEEGWEKSLETEIAEMTKELPDAAKNIMKLATKGGDIDAYIRTLHANVTAPINKDTDITLEENQVLAMQLELKDQEYDDEYIETHINNLKESGKLEAMAKKVFDKRIAKQAQAEEAVVAQAEANKAQAKKNIETYKAGIVETLGATDNIKGLVINKDLKKKLPEFMSVPAVQLDNGKVITKMQEKLFGVLADKNKSILLAALLENDFDFSSISAATLTAYSKAIREDVTNSGQGKSKEVKSSGSSQKVKKSLADLLD